MPFIGNQLSTSFQNVETQTITGDGSTSYTLNNAVADGKDLLVYINNVKQEEGSGKSYTATGTTITFTEAVASTDSCYVVFIGQAVGTVTPKDGSIVSSMLADANLEMPNTLDLNGKELILDADADTSITADTDDQIDIKIAGSDNLRIKANEIENVSGNLTLDVAGSIILDADGADYFFKNGGTEVFRLSGDATPANVTMRVMPSDGDLIFKGNDGGSTVTALTLDMSEGGRATFNDVVRIPTNLEHDGDADTFFGFPSANNFIITAGNVSRVYGSATETVINEDSNNIDFRVESDDNANALLVDAGNESVGLFADSDDTSKNKVAVGLTGTVVAGDTDGATIGKNAIFKLFDDTNWASTDSTIFLMGGGTGGVVGQISSAIGFARESNTNWGTQLKFYTHSTATSDLDELKERMRLNSDGTLMLGTTNLVGAQSGNVDSMVALYQRGQIAVTNNDADFSMFVNKRDSTTGGLIRFRYNGSTIGSITNDTSSVTYNTSSDYRLKENVVTDWDATTRLKQLKPSRFNFKVDKDKTVDGFLAHEVSSIVPEAVSGEKDAVDKDGNIDPQGIDQSKLVPLLTKALQEAISEIDTLKEKVTALEAK